MHKTVQAWFTDGPSSNLDKKPTALLADWNTYAAASNTYEGDPSAFDLKAAVRTANEKVSSMFSVVSKGVRELPGSFNSATSSVPSGKSLIYSGVFLAVGVFFIFIAFTIFLPVMVLKPQKFAIRFTIGCAFIVGSFFVVKGPKNQLAHSTTTFFLSFSQCYRSLLFHMMLSRTFLEDQLA